jgi:ABC transporter substrate binding protein
MPRIGLIDEEPLWNNFRQGLRDLGYVENQNIAIEYRPAESKVDRLAQAARELVSLPVDVIIVGGSPAARAAQQATSTIPIVMISIGDPVRAGFAASLGGKHDRVLRICTRSHRQAIGDSKGMRSRPGTCCLSLESRQ